MRTWPGILGILALAACTQAVRKSDPAAAASWQEYRSAHFLIEVAAWHRDPAHLVAAFEELHAAVLAALVSEPVEIPGRVRVVVLASRRDLREMTGSDAIAGLF